MLLRDKVILQNKIVRNADAQFLLVAAVFAALFFSAWAGFLGSNALRYLLQIFLYICLGEMWNLLSGFTGMTSLGQQLFIGLSGYAVAVATTTYDLPLGIGICAGVLLSVLAAYLFSFFLFRIEGMYFAIATWVLAEAIATFFLSWKYVGQGSGMIVSLRPYPKVKDIYFMSLALCAASLSATCLLLRSRIGLGLAAMRDDLPAAAASGVDVARLKRLVYLVAALFTALAGGIFFVNKGTIYPDSGFHIGWTVSMVFIVIIGGVGTVGGPIVGAVIYVFLEEYLAHYPGWSKLILGAIAIAVILFLPDGILGTLQKRFRFELFSQRRSP